ncbi:MAG TPA: hypothetical protein VMU51_00050 [Mycobacteriales bacterium]|nr:hypothetical protein [Mycobacteriales bacterium]
MTGKLALVAGFAAGYVLGSKAGRERYEQIVGASHRLWSNPTVQSTAGVLQAQATDLVNKAKENELVSRAVHTVRGDHSTPGGYQPSAMGSTERANGTGP